jgi:hypothetical protein
MSFDTRINRLKRRLNRQDGPIFLTIIGDPEVRKLRHEGRLGPFSMASPRHAMIGQDYYEAAADESVEAFHERLKQIARECGAFFINLGHPENAEPPAYPPPSTSDGRRQRYDA